MADRASEPRLVAIRAFASPPNPDRAGVAFCLWTTPGGFVVIERAGMPTLTIPPEELARAAIAFGLDPAEFGLAPDAGGEVADG